VPLRRAAARVLGPHDPALRIRALGMELASPVGLAAGFDKDARLAAPLGALGFGFVEVGTLTAAAQPGNPRPRLFRLPADHALVNRMGFNNGGAAAAAARLARSGAEVPVGVNIGRTKVAQGAAADYRASARVLAPHAAYLVLNVSSPNTPGLRDLQTAERLRELVAAARAAMTEAGADVPLLVKIAPDLADEDIDAIADLALSEGLDGIIATNTTIGRAGLRTAEDAVAAVGAGGLSGAPLRERALEVLRRLHARVGDRLVLVAAGGVTSGDDVVERLRAGATLVQAYTAFVYGGPLWPNRVHRELSRHVREAGVRSVADLVGAGAGGP